MMNLAQYKINGNMPRDAITSLSHFASINERVGAAGIANIPDTTGEPESYTGALTLIASDARYECDFSPAGFARITKCTSNATALVIPDDIEGRPVIVIGSHAFSTCYALEHVNLPARLSTIDSYAFMNTALTSLLCPHALRSIADNAFYKCTRLQSAALNEGLEHIGDNAFRESALAALCVPASVSFIGHDAFRGTGLVFNGPGRCSLLVASDNPHYRLDGSALYHIGADGLTLTQLLDDTMRHYRGPDNLVVVAARAFSHNKKLERVTLPFGTVSIGEAAFKGCSALALVDMPDSVRFIGKNAFWDTALAKLRIPSALEEAGTNAFYTGGSIAHHFKRTIQHIEISPGNERFWLDEGTLYQDRGNAGAIALLYIGDATRVTIPRNVTAIGAYAFLNAANVRELHIHDGIESIDVGGLDFGHALATVIYDVYDGDKVAKRYVIDFPPGYAGRQAVRQTFARGRFNLAYAYASADNAILITQDVFIRGKAMLERMSNPIMLDARMRAEYVKRLERSLSATVVAFGKGGFVQGIDLLLELGILTRGTIDDAVEAANEAGEIAALSRLIQLKRTAFATSMFDFDL